jgi:3-oxoacyl-[acyl-carrier-protein] synthase II
MIEPVQNIVVTGLAAISAAGVGLDPLREALRSRASALRPVPAEILAGADCRWGKADGFKAADFMPPLKARKFDRASLLAVAAAGMALRDAGLDAKAYDPLRIGIVLGCGFGGIANSAEFLSGYFQQGVEGLSPMLFPNTVANAPASNASIEHGLKGPNVTIVQRFCSAETAFHIACRFLAEDRADIVITGGVDELTPLMLKGFQAMGQLGRFAQDYAEGCGLVVLEKADHAARRGAAVKGTVGAIRTVGLLLPGQEQAGIDRLLAGSVGAGLIALSGTADLMPPLLDRLPAGPRLALAPLTGRSIAMGGLTLAALLLSLAPGQKGLQLAASPEGPYFAIDLQGGVPVQS